MIIKINFYSNKIVNKPWGYEYVIYSNSDKLAITLVKINYGHKTSLHCHPQKNRFYNFIGQSSGANRDI